MGLFKQGYQAAREEAQRQEEVRANSGKRLWRFYLPKDGDEATVRYLTEEPINFQEHTIKTTRNGKDSYDTHICTKEMGHCLYCDNGDRPSFKGAFLIIDKRPYEYTDKNGKKKTAKGQVRLYVSGARIISQLDRLSSRYGLTKRDYIITRSGSGTSTTYMFDRSDDIDRLTPEEIKNFLPEKLREDYDGTEESLYKILQDQLEMDIDSSVSNDDDEEDDDSEEYSSRRNLVGVDDEDEDEDEDEEEEEPPKKKSSKSAPAPAKKGGMFKKRPKENSVKSIMRKK